LCLSCDSRSAQDCNLNKPSFKVNV